jgi:hypothetical protein
MAIVYKIIQTELGNDLITRTGEDGIVYFIPTDPANSDYQRYLRWLENPDAEQYTPPLPIVIEEVTKPPTEQTQEGAE